MSSYHVLNALWVGIFPMLVVSLIIGITIYLLCCLNHMKKRCVEYCHHRKTKQKKQLRKKLQKSKTDVESNSQPETFVVLKKSQSSQDYKSKKPDKKQSKSCFKTFYADYYDDDEDDIKLPSRKLLPKQEVEEYLTVNNETNAMIRSNQPLGVMQEQGPPPLPLTVPPPQSKTTEYQNQKEKNDYLEKRTKQERLNRTSLTLDLKTNNNIYFNKSKSLHINNPAVADSIVDELDSEPLVLAAGSIYSSSTIRSSKSLNINETKLYTRKKERNSSSNNIEQLIVHELKESPKGIYARLKCLRNNKSKKLKCHYLFMQDNIYSTSVY